MKTKIKASAARLTPPGRGGVATIRVIGELENIDQSPTRFFRAVNKKAIHEQPVNRLAYGYWREEDVVLSVREKTMLEIHCHGGEVAVSRILDDLESIGFEPTTWQNQLEENDSLFECEYQTALSKAITQKTASILLKQKENWNLAVQKIEQPQFENQTNDLIAFVSEILSWKQFGQHLVQPWQVVLAGRPNVGKSSLINRLIGYDRAIVHNQPGTTRDAVSAETAFDGWPVTLTDTAGLRETMDEIEKEGVQRAESHLQNADLLLIVLDRSSKPNDEDLRILKTAHPNRIVLANKSDLTDEWKSDLPDDAILVSAENGDGIEKLIASITERLIPKKPNEKQLVPFTQRQVDHFQGILDSLK